MEHTHQLKYNFFCIVLCWLVEWVGISRRISNRAENAKCLNFFFRPNRWRAVHKYCEHALTRTIKFARSFIHRSARCFSSFLSRTIKAVEWFFFARMCFFFDFRLSLWSDKRHTQRDKESTIKRQAMCVITVQFCWKKSFSRYVIIHGNAKWKVNWTRHNYVHCSQFLLDLFSSIDSDWTVHFFYRWIYENRSYQKW